MPTTDTYPHWTPTTPNTGLNYLRPLIPRGKMSAKEFMDAVGISKTTLIKLRKEGVVHPEQLKTGRSAYLYLYDRRDMEAVFRYQNGLGRPGSVYADAS